MNRAGDAYSSAMDKYNRELFSYYQRLMHILLLVGDELAANGIRGVNSRFPWLAGSYNRTDGRGYVRGPDGESVLGVEPEHGQKHPFPVNWNGLRKAIIYSMRNYGDFDDWWIVDASSINLHGTYIMGWFPYIFLSDEAFHGSEFSALSDMIHEPMHDVCMYGRGHGGPEKEIVPMVVPATSEYGSAFYQLHWFLKTAVDSEGVSLWSKILKWAGPKPVKPTKPNILQ